MKVGDIVKPTQESGYHLRSGASAYTEAVVISKTPFVLTSKESDMRWEATIKEDDFEVVGQAENSVLKHCMRRL